MADKQDAQAIIGLARWGSQMGLDEAYVTLFGDGFDPDSADPSDPFIFRVLTFGETIATLTKHGLLDTDLVLDWLWVAGLWQRLAPVAAKHRAQTGEPSLWENFEQLAAKQH